MVDVKKAYGLLAAVGTKLGERARTDEGLLARVRETTNAAEFRAKVRESTQGLLPDALVATFLDEVVAETDWILWRSRLLIQMRMVRDGKSPAKGHEGGKGVGRS